MSHFLLLMAAVAVAALAPLATPGGRAFYQHAYQRLKADTPPFWRKIRNLSASALVVVGALLGDVDKVGEELAHYLRYAFVGLTAVAGTAQLTCQDPPKKDALPTDQPAA